VAAGAALGVAGEVGSGDEQSGQDAVVNEADVLASPPQFEERGGGDVVSVGAATSGDQSQGVAVYAGVVAVEEDPEGVAVPAQAGGPVLAVGCGVHAL
jgi:hypothetical protein